MVLSGIQFFSAAVGTPNLLGSAGSTILLGSPPAEDQLELRTNSLEAKEWPCERTGAAEEAGSGPGSALLALCGLGHVTLPLRPQLSLVMCNMTPICRVILRIERNDNGGKMCGKFVGLPWTGQATLTRVQREKELEQHTQALAPPDSRTKESKSLLLKQEHSQLFLKEDVFSEQGEACWGDPGAS